MKLGLYRARSLGCKHLYATSHQRRQQGYREEHDTKTAYPLGKRAPKQNAVWQSVHIVDNGGSGSGESRHRLEEGVGKRVQIAAYKEGQRAEERENHPRKRNHKICVAAREVVVAVACKQSQHQCCSRRYGYGADKRQKVVLVVINRHAKAHQQHHCLYEEQRANNLVYQFEIYHRKNFSIFFMFRLWQNTITESPGRIIVLPDTSSP